MKNLLSSEKGSAFFGLIIIVVLIVAALSMAVKYKKNNPDVKWGLPSPASSGDKKSSNGEKTGSLWGKKSAEVVDAIQQKGLNSSGMALRDVPPEKQGTYYRDHKQPK